MRLGWISPVYGVPSRVKLSALQLPNCSFSYRELMLLIAISSKFHLGCLSALRSAVPPWLWVLWGQYGRGACKRRRLACTPD